MAADPLISYLKVQRDHERKLLAALRAAAQATDAELRRLAGSGRIGDVVRSQQLRGAQVALQREITRLMAVVLEVVEEGRQEAAQVASQVMWAADAEVLRRAGVDPARLTLIQRSLQASASYGIDVVESRVLGMSRIPLSGRVYQTNALVSGQLERIIENHLARGSSPAELARDVRGFINPNTPGGVRYAAMRLARTEINNAFHATSIRHAMSTPWAVGMKWHLSDSHPKPDKCNDYAEKSHYEGGEVGVFKTESVPGKPHPQCLCYVTTVLPSRSSFMDSLLAGEYDDDIDELETNGYVRF